MQYINCKQYAQEILDSVKAVQDKKTLAIISVWDNPASQSYIKGKIKDCEYCGVPYRHIRITDKLDWYWQTCSTVSALNETFGVGGIIVQLPLPVPEKEKIITNMIYPQKDVDGFKHDSPFQPCTPEAVMYVLEQELGDLTGKKALIIGRGTLVGKPLMPMLLDKDCTITVAHSKTPHLDKLLGDYDIIISAAGKPNLVDLSKCKCEVVIDVGVNRDANGKLCGDCYNFQDTGGGMKVTSVPGGIGLMTRAMLMKHMSEV